MAAIMASGAVRSRSKRIWLEATTPVRVFDVAEFRHVDIPVRRATGWIAAFTAEPRDRLGHTLVRVSTQSASSRTFWMRNVC
jgi:hypothetical protein